jgi:hypothetical protein
LRTCLVSKGVIIFFASAILRIHMSALMAMLATLASVLSSVPSKAC